MFGTGNDSEWWRGIPDVYGNATTKALQAYQYACTILVVFRFWERLLAFVHVGWWEVLGGRKRDRVHCNVPTPNNNTCYYVTQSIILPLFWGLCLTFVFPGVGTPLAQREKRRTLGTRIIWQRCGAGGWSSHTTFSSSAGSGFIPPGSATAKGGTTLRTLRPTLFIRYLFTINSLVD